MILPEHLAEPDGKGNPTYRVGRYRVVVALDDPEVVITIIDEDF